jgi:hypothetical protein
LTLYLGQLKILRNLLGEVAELVIGERDLVDLDDSEAETDRIDSYSEMVQQRSQGRQPQRQTVKKGKLLDVLRMASVDNFQVRAVATQADYLE